MKPRIVLVTDPAFDDDTIVGCVEGAARALPAHALCVQLRDKGRGPRSLRLWAWRLRAVTRRVGAGLVVNGDAAIARDVGADGVHLGGGAGSVLQARALVGASAWISIAAHSDDDVRRAVNEGADAALVSPVFASRPPSPRAAEKSPRGLGALRVARSLAEGRVAVFALGGVTLDRVRPCAEAGAEGVAVLRALLTSREPGRLARAIHDVLAPRG
jgi:thiamine-phosphate pyrophosphorylase